VLLQLLGLCEEAETDIAQVQSLLLEAKREGRVVPSLDLFSFVAYDQLIYRLDFSCFLVLLDLLLIKSSVLVVLEQLSLQYLRSLLCFDFLLAFLDGLLNKRLV